MVPTNLNDIFTSLRAKKGDEIAQTCVDNTKIQDFDLRVETLSMSLQMQFSRLQNSNLQKWQSREIGKEIKRIVNDGIQELINTYLDQEDFFRNEMHNLFTKIKTDMSEKAKNAASDMKNLNIVLDFEKIAFELKDLQYADVVRVLKTLIIVNVYRRAKRSQFLTND